MAENLPLFIKNVVARNTRLYGEDDTPAIVDNYDGTNALAVIDTLHNRVHRGQMFTVDFVDLTVATDGTLQILFVVPAERRAHFRFQINSGGDARIQLFEGVTTSDNGTLLLPINRNRTSEFTPRCSAYSGPTISDVGDAILDQIDPGGTGVTFSVGGRGHSFEEYILGENVYLLRATNLAGSGQPVSIEINWYENVRDI